VVVNGRIPTTTVANALSRVISLLAISVVRGMTHSSSYGRLAGWPIGSGNGLPPPPARGEGDPDGDGMPPNALEP
jgi:hypothetical protein